MLVIPAIDLRGGLCVRLRQGDFGRESVYGEDPAAVAARWESDGASWIHLVDLDGAREGRPVNVEAVKRILDRVSIPCQLGGGVRDESTIMAWLDAGIARVIVGTQAVRDPDWFGEMAGKYPARLLLGLDARGSRVATEGWLQTTNTDAIALASRFDDRPLAGIVYTDIGRDGTLEGPNWEATRLLAERVRVPVFASGGVGRLDDLARLAELRIAGVVVGLALYEGRFTLAEAIQRVGGVVPLP
jgi:phosphoribosylformimino-5-aminoimidazole carboxamide ribotide isomerase